MKRKKSTARKGNPGQASRGAAVEREKKELGNKYEFLALFTMAHLEKIKFTKIHRWLATATLAEVHAASKRATAFWQAFDKYVAQLKRAALKAEDAKRPRPRQKKRCRNRKPRPKHRDVRRPGSPQLQRLRRLAA